MVTFGGDAKDSGKNDKGASLRQETSVKTATIPSGSAALKDTRKTHGGDSILPPSRRKHVVNKRSRAGFGLVQWQRLVRSSKDLAQRKGAPFRRNISWEEIRQHDQPHDGWMVLRGIVYNIGPYLAYHPGGIDIITKANLLGKDGTKLFDKYHQWVSIEGLIGKLAIGSVAGCEMPIIEDGEESEEDY